MYTHMYVCIQIYTHVYIELDIYVYIYISYTRRVCVYKQSVLKPETPIPAGTVVFGILCSIRFQGTIAIFTFTALSLYMLVTQGMLRHGTLHRLRYCNALGFKASGFRV